MKTIQQILAGTPDIREITKPEILDLFTRLHNKGWEVVNQRSTVHAQHGDYICMYSKVSHNIMCYYLGYGHCSVSCSLMDFQDVDHIYTWVEQQKLVELTEPPTDVKFEDRLEHVGVKKRKWLNDDQIQEIVRFVNNGHSQAEVGRMFGISNATVSYYRKKFLN